MNWFNDLRIGVKLAIGFAGITLLSMALGAFTFSRTATSITEFDRIQNDWVPGTQAMAEIRAQLGEFRTYELAQIARADDPKAVEDYFNRKRKLRDDVAATQGVIEKSLIDPKEKEMYAQAKDSLAKYLAASSELDEAIRQHDVAAAQTISDDKSRPLRRDLFKQLVALTDHALAKLQSEMDATRADLRQTKMLILITLALVVALAAAIGWFISRGITRQLEAAVALSRAVAQGNLETQVAPPSRDEIGALMRDLLSMRQVIHNVLDAQQEMGRQHSEGWISYRIDEDAFPGQYGEMVRGTNVLVATHIAVKMSVVEMAKRYAMGDLSQRMDDLPNEKAVVSQAVNDVRTSMLDINTEIKRLSAAAAAGDFSARGEVDRFDYDFAEMIGNLNNMMAVSEQSLGELSGLLRAIADGDLTHRMEGEFHGVFAAMRDDGNATIERLTEIVSRIQDAAGNINTASSEIAAGNSDLSVRTEQQAANLEETAASMEELTSTVRQNAESARQANQLAVGAADVASKGGAVVGQVVTTMSDIETSSKKIAEIISVIDGIAFQTNILALNAAVEAARAGEQGRGFAVVASEVRTLAQRSANAAKEIKGLIDDSVSKVANGSALVDQAGKTMGEIVSSVQRVTDIMGEISAASQEQSSGIEQVNLTITQMDETTQQNAALVEEATAAARAMEEQASQLNETVAVFRTHRAQAGAKAEVSRLLDASRVHSQATPTPVKPATKPKAPAARTGAARKRQESSSVAAAAHWEEF